MINYKKIIAEEISKAIDLNSNEIQSYIEVPKETKNGDYSFPCFRLAKQLKKAPQVIAPEIKEKIKIDENIVSKIDVLGGYLNFYINKQNLTQNVLGEISEQQE